MAGIRKLGERMGDVIHDIRVVNSYNSFGYSIYFTREVTGEGIYIGRIVDGYIRYDETPIKEGERTIPTINLGDEQIEKIIEEMAKLGCKPKVESKLEGQLEATKYHLEDIRTLMKLNKREESKNNNET